MNDSFSENDGIVLCKCGGKILAINGKIMLTELTHNILCRACNEEYNVDEIFECREKNTRVVYYKNYGKPT